MPEPVRFDAVQFDEDFLNAAAGGLRWRSSFRSGGTATLPVLLGG
jgi:hypothetical protein